MDAIIQMLNQPEFLIASGTFLFTLVTMWANFSTRMTVLEKSVYDLEVMVNEMRLDIKALLASNIINK